LYNSLADDLPGAEDVVNNPVNVLERDGEVIAFYEMRDRGDHIELLRMFQKVELIGHGYGRMMWDHCVQEARQMGARRMRIISDPGAIGFYEAMGATLERLQEVAPGFSLGLFWYDLR
jgi:predicted GNAT family acetyltransferase